MHMYIQETYGISQRNVLVRTCKMTRAIDFYGIYVISVMVIAWIPFYHPVAGS